MPLKRVVTWRMTWMRTKHERQTRKEMRSACKNRSHDKWEKKWKKASIVSLDGHPSNGSFRAALTLIDFASFISCWTRVCVCPNFVLFFVCLFFAVLPWTRTWECDNCNCIGVAYCSNHVTIHSTPPTRIFMWTKKAIRRYSTIFVR